MGLRPLLFCVLFLGASAFAEQRDIEKRTPSPINLQAECLRYRNEISQSGRVFLHSVTEDRNGRSEVEFRIWFTPERLRFDIRRLRNEEWNGWEYYVIEGDRYTWIPEGQFEGVIAPAVEHTDQEGVMKHFVLFHPRWLGMGQNSESSLHSEPGARFVDPGVTKATYTVAADRIEGSEAWRVTRETSFPGKSSDTPRIPGEFVMWFAPDAGMSLLRAELREFGEKATHVMSVASELEQFPITNAWYPRRVVRETAVDGRVYRRQVISVQEIVLGEPPSDKTFTVAAMDLPKGKQISDRSSGPSETVLVWDGASAVPIRGPDVMPMVPPAPSSTGRSTTFWILAAHAVLFAVIGLACAARWYLNRI